MALITVDTRYTGKWIGGVLGLRMEERTLVSREINIFCLESLFRNNIRVARNLLENLRGCLARRFNQSTLY